MPAGRQRERTRIAREIHDVLAHSLGALGIQLQAVRALLADQGDTHRALSLLDQAQRMAKDGLAETRRAVHALRADTAGLDEQLAVLADTYRSRHHASVSFRVGGQPRRRAAATCPTGSPAAKPNFSRSSPGA